MFQKTTDVLLHKQTEQKTTALMGIACVVFAPHVTGLLRNFK
mgnify:FL=1